MVNLSIRPMVTDDIPYIIAYWYEKPENDFLKMGADKTKFPSRSEFDTALKIICDTPIEKAKTFVLVWLINNKLIGYTMLRDIIKEEIAHMHLHMWNVEYRGKGYGAKLFCMSVVEFYKLFNLKLILCEPRSSNPMPNKMLTKIGFKKWKTYISTSGELALTCEVNSYIIDPKIASDYLEKNTLYGKA